MDNTPNENQEQNKEKLENISDSSEELQLEQTGKAKKIVSKIKKSLSALLGKLAFLKKKRFWIPLLIFHIVLFSGTAYYAHYELTKVHKPGYVLASLQKSLAVKDPVLFNSIININEFSENFIADLVNSVPKYKYVCMRMGEIPSTNTIRDNISFLLLDILKGNDYISEFNTKTGFIPKNISQLLTDAPLHIIPSENSDQYIIETTVYDPFWENIPVKLQAVSTENGIKINKLANLNEILQTYNNKLAKRYQQEQNFQHIETKQELYKITQYLPNSSCSTQLGYVNKKHILFIDYKADANYKDSNIISFAAQITITNEEGLHIAEETLKSNKLFIPKHVIQTSWRLPIDDNQFEMLKASKKILCEVTPVMVNAENGDYFDIRKK